MKENRTHVLEHDCSVLCSRTQNRTEHREQNLARTQNRTEQRTRIDLEHRTEQEHWLEKSLETDLIPHAMIILLCLFYATNTDQLTALRGGKSAFRAQLISFYLIWYMCEISGLCPDDRVHQSPNSSCSDCSPFSKFFKIFGVRTVRSKWARPVRLFGLFVNFSVCSSEQSNS